MTGWNSAMRYDLQIIADWIEPGSKVIDLGCGEGDLLQHLISDKGVQGRRPAASKRGFRSCRGTSTKRCGIIPKGASTTSS
jgi:cyclopropane fatty-acyl-phospholipid synthase-like methyltransferase